MARHDQLLRAVVARHGGVVFSTMGAAWRPAFQTASTAVACAVEAQGVLHQESWGTVRPLQVRMGLHTGEAELRDGDYFGTTVSRAAAAQGLTIVPLGSPNGRRPPVVAGRNPKSGGTVWSWPNPKWPQ
jgi:class 3 adenylate cyclase